jgi:hypothetical protein
MRTATCLGLLAFALPTAAAEPINLVINPGFDANLSGWTQPNTAPFAEWSMDDHSGVQTSGSAHIVDNTAVGGGSIRIVLTQCVSIATAGYYAIGSAQKVPLNQNGGVAFSFAASATSDCSGGGTPNYLGAFVDGQWHTKLFQLGLLPSHSSVLINLTEAKFDGSSFNAFYDDIIVSKDLIFRSGSEE